MPVSRRQVIGALGLGVATAGAGAGTGAALAHASSAADRHAADQAARLRDAVPFDGEHQAGIVTPAPDRLHFAAFDLTTTDRSALIDLLHVWTAAARRMTSGLDAGPTGAFGGTAEAPPEDTGEAAGLPPAGLTLTIGFGRSLFDHPTLGDRFGLKAHLPPALITLPPFAGDNLNPATVDGDLCIQACGNDPQVVSHAIRNLSRLGFGRAALRWSQLGFGRTSSTAAAQQTARNLFGQKDGTNNPRAEDTSVINEQVWVPADDGPSWMTGGSYLVARRIRMHVETWDRTALGEQEKVIGRTKAEGAPLSGTREFDTPDFAAPGPHGTPAIDPRSHMRLAHPSSNGGMHLLRRGYNFIDGNDAFGHLDAGLFFIAYQRDPRTQFVPIQTRLAQGDLLNEYVQHTGSGLFAVPPGVRAGQAWGHTLF